MMSNERMYELESKKEIIVLDRDLPSFSIKTQFHFEALSASAKATGFGFAATAETSNL